MTVLTESRAADALTEHLDPVDPREAIRTGECMIGTMETEGWRLFLEAVAARRAALDARLIHRMKPLEPAESEGLAGEIRALDSIESIADGLIVMGEEAELLLRTRQQEAMRGGE